MTVFFALKKHAFILITAILLASFQGVSASLPNNWPHEKSDLKSDPKITYGILANGLRFAVMPNQTPSGQASIRLLFDVGSKHEYDDERGIAHFIEHMAFNGSTNVPEGEMVKILERHGLAFGADANAYTSYNQTVYQLDLPNMEPATVDTAFMLMRETASNITFAPEAIDRERGVVLAEKRRTNVHAMKTQEAQTSFLYPDTRTLIRKPIGTEEGISTISREQMLRFYRQFYRPKNAFFVVVGDFNTDEMTSIIKETFSDWQAVGEPRDTEYAKDPAQSRVGDNQALHFLNEQATSFISVSLNSDYTQRDDTAHNRYKSLLSYAANSIFNKRLSDLRLEGKAAFLGAGASKSSYNKIADVASLGITIEEGQWQSGLKDAVTELNRALAYGFTEAELVELLANLKTSFEYAVDSADKRQTINLANNILHSFANDRVAASPQTSLALFNQFAKEVTLEALHTEFQKSWSNIPAKLFFVSKNKIENAEETMLAIFENGLTTSVGKIEENISQKFAYTDFGEAGKVINRFHTPQTNSTSVLFANNVMLNIKKTELQTETVQMLLRFGGGLLSAPKNQPGILTLLSGTFSNGGTEIHSATDLRRLLAGRTASANLGANTDAFSFRSAVTPKDMLLQLQLWAAYMTAPAYRNEAIVQYQRSIEAIYHALDNTPSQVSRYQVGRLLYSGDPRFFLPPKETIQSLGAKDLKAFFTNELTKSAIEISIVGNIEIDQAIAAVATTFGTFKTREQKPRPFTNERKVIFPDPGETVLFHKGGQDQAIVQLYWKTADYYNDIPQSARLDLLRSVLNDRLREAIREGLATSYAPNVSNLESDTFPDFGYFSVIVDAKPNDVNKITEIIHSEISRLTAGEVSLDDIERARKPFLESFENAKENNNHWLGRISRAQSDPRTLDNQDTIIQTWLNTTPSELQALAAQYLLKDATVEILILPEPEKQKIL